MEARLVQIEADRPISATPLSRPEMLIGRDPAADVVVEFSRVSRRHALVRELGGRHTIADLGSSNGTTVNGVPVHDAVLLEPGDRIALGNEVTLLYEPVPPARRVPLPAIAAGALLVVALVAGATVWRCARPDPIFQQALELASEGERAARAGDALTAKARLQSAWHLLYQKGYLDDVPRAEVMRVAMERLGEHLDGGVDLWTLFRDVLEAARPRPAPAQSQRIGCRLDEVAARDLEACLRERIELVLYALRQDPTSVPDGFHREVGARLRREHAYIRRALEQGRPIIPMLRREFEAANMPPLLHYVALIESGYNNNAVSPAKAVGMWQFMPATARHYGLVVRGSTDERRDHVKSTRAAVQYLRDLAFEFGGEALLLALAGYNRGENGVRRALKRMDDPFSDRSYWRLVEKKLLPEETAKYVPRFMAAAVAGEAGLPSPEVLVAAGY
jgi:hypothetical protein